MFDAILILGGGVREGGELPRWSRARFDRALERADAEIFLCSSAGTRRRPPPLEHGYPIAEAVAGARYLMSRGIPPRRIRIEAASYDTIGNAYFAKLLHVDPAGWRRLLVITSDWHMPRSRAIFEWVFGFEPGRYELEFDAIADPSLSPAALARREEKERRALESLCALQQRVRSLAEFHEWLFSEHGVYSAQGGRGNGDVDDPALRDSY